MLSSGTGQSYYVTLTGREGGGITHQLTGETVWLSDRLTYPAGRAGLEPGPL